MGVPSRTSAPTPALDQTFDIQIILGKVRPFLRRLAEAHPQVLIIARVVGRTVKDIANKYGVGKDIDDSTWAVATVGGKGDRSRKINVQENKVSSISFPIKRQSVTRAPSRKEFYAVANQIVQDVRSGVGLGSLSVGAPGDADTRTINQIDTTNWTVPDEVTSDEGSN